MSRGRRIVRAGGIFACSVFALLLWSKLKLVSGIPRTAYATPESQAPRPRADASPDQGGHTRPIEPRHASAPQDGAP